MKKKVLLMFVLTVCVASSAQTQKMADMFATVPDSLLPLLSPNNRRDMLDFLSNGMEARVRNQLNEESTLRTLNDTYLLIDMSVKSRVEMKLLHTADSACVVAIVRTVAGPAADSEVEFYDSGWRRIRWIEFPRPAISEFWRQIPDSLAVDAGYAQLSLADLRLIEVRVSPDEPVFELLLDTSELAEKEKDAAKMLVHPLLYFWDGEAFLKRE